MPKNVDRKYIRARSADFVKSIVEISRRKEEPASPLAPVVDVKKIEDITMKLKEQSADRNKNYWEKPDKKKLEKKLK